MSMTDLERAQLRTWANRRLADGRHAGDALLPLALKALDEVEELMGYDPLTYSETTYPKEFENAITLDEAK